MEYLFWIVITIVIFIIQTQVDFLNQPLNITTVLVCVFGIKNIVKNPHVKGYWSGKGEIKSALFGAIVGLIEDGLSNSIIGPSLLSKALIGFASAYIFTEIFFRWTSLTVASVLALLTVFDSIVIVSLRVLMTTIKINTFLFYEMLLIQVVTNMIIGFLVKLNREEIQ